jgi:hypothetical protein
MGVRRFYCNWSLWRLNPKSTFFKAVKQWTVTIEQKEFFLETLKLLLEL